MLEDKKLWGIIAGGLAVLLIIFFLGYGCGQSSVEKKYQKQSEVLQKIKSLVQDSV